MAVYPEFDNEELIKRLKRVTRTDVIRAIREFQTDFPNPDDYENFLNNGQHKWLLEFEGQLFPCKYIMGQAIRAHHRQLAGGWGGGKRVNPYFKELGFEIVLKP